MFQILGYIIVLHIKPLYLPKWLKLFYMLAITIYEYSVPTYISRYTLLISK